MANENNGKALSGYRIIIGILVVILVGVSALYFNIHNQQKADYGLLLVERDAVQGDLTELIADYESLETSNNQLKVNMEIERNRADSVITALQKERAFNYSKLKKYERELSTLRTAMRGYLQQIDSLNNLNQQLISENVSYKKQLTDTELRAKEAEEREQALKDRIAEGARLRAESIEITSLNKKGRTISRAKRAKRLSVNFNVAANELTKPGKKNIVARITAPNGSLLATADAPSFQYNGKKLPYSSSREIDYQNATLPVSIFFAGEGFAAGVYVVELYDGDYMIGTSKVNIR